MNEHAHHRLIDCRQAMQESSLILKGLVNSLSRVGLDSLANDLWHISRALDDGVLALNEGMAEAINHYVKTSEEATANMLGAALAVATTIRPTPEHTP